MQPIAAILIHRWTAFVARVLLTFPFWFSGIVRLLDFTGGTAEMGIFGLDPPWAFNAATAAVQLLGSALIIAGRASWLGAGMLGVFTLLTIPIAHNFWALQGFEAIVAFHTTTEHVGMIGALIVAAVLAQHRTGSTAVRSARAG